MVSFHSCIFWCPTIPNCAAFLPRSAFFVSRFERLNPKSCFVDWQNPCSQTLCFFNPFRSQETKITENTGRRPQGKNIELLLQAKILDVRLHGTQFVSSVAQMHGHTHTRVVIIPLLSVWSIILHAFWVDSTLVFCAALLESYIFVFQNFTAEKSSLKIKKWMIRNELFCGRCQDPWAQHLCERCWAETVVRYWHMFFHQFLVVLQVRFALATFVSAMWTVIACRARKRCSNTSLSWRFYLQIGLYIFSEKIVMLGIVWLFCVVCRSVRMCVNWGICIRNQWEPTLSRLPATSLTIPQLPAVSRTVLIPFPFHNPETNQHLRAQNATTQKIGKTQPQRRNRWKHGAAHTPRSIFCPTYDCQCAVFGVATS